MDSTHLRESHKWTDGEGRIRGRWACVMLVLAGIVFSLSQSALAQEVAPNDVPRQVVLTWQDNPSTSMTITWRTDVPVENPALQYAVAPAENGGAMQQAAARSFTFSRSPAHYHTVRLNDLKPDTLYEVIISHAQQAERFTFRTAPDSADKEIVFLAGGDARSDRKARQAMNELAAKEKPLFVMFDGDFVSNAVGEGAWDEFFDDWHNQLITENRRRIPIVPAVGNHEVIGANRHDRTKEHAPYYYNRFQLPEPQSHYVLDFGPALSIITLDSFHTTPLPDQVPWLKATLEARKNRPWNLVQYHQAAWPSSAARGADAPRPTWIRDAWHPIFEEYGVRVVFESHEHSYKRTVPIFNNQEDAERGVIYVGDGGWGAPLRPVKDPKDHWWLAESASVHNFCKITLSDNGRKLRIEPIVRGNATVTPFELTARPATQE